MMVCAQVMGNDACVGFSGSQGNLELNVMMPVMARNVLESARLIANVARLLADKVVDGMEADSSAPASTPSPRRRSSPAELEDRLRGGGGHREAGAEGATGPSARS